MTRIIIFIVAVYYIGLALMMWAMPHTWYETTPGVAMMGPFNLHFIRDAALAYLVSGGALALGTLKQNRGVAITGAAWPALHGLFHIWIWLSRGVPFDLIAAVNLSAIQLPAWLTLALLLRSTHRE